MSQRLRTVAQELVRFSSLPVVQCTAAMVEEQPDSDVHGVPDAVRNHNDHSHSRVHSVLHIVAFLWHQKPALGQRSGTTELGIVCLPYNPRTSLKSASM